MLLCPNWNVFIGYIAVHVNGNPFAMCLLFTSTSKMVGKNLVGHACTQVTLDLALILNSPDTTTFYIFLFIKSFIKVQVRWLNNWENKSMNFLNLLVNFFYCFQAAVAFLKLAALRVIIWQLCWGQGFSQERRKNVQTTIYAGTVNHLLGVSQ